MFENCTVKYQQYINGINDSVSVTYPQDDNGMVVGKNIPMNEENTDYQELLAWVAEVDENGVSKGNVIEEAD